MDRLARGKQSVSVDLKNKDGINVVRKLASKADVLIEPFRKGACILVLSLTSVNRDIKSS